MKKIKITPEMRKIFEDQHDRFVEKFGREPGPKDPVFFDPDSDVPTKMPAAPLREVVLEVCAMTGLDVERTMRTLGLDEEE